MNFINLDTLPKYYINSNYAEEMMKLCLYPCPDSVLQLITKKLYVVEFPIFQSFAPGGKLKHTSKYVNTDIGIVFTNLGSIYTISVYLENLEYKYKIHCDRINLIIPKSFKLNMIIKLAKFKSIEVISQLLEIYCTGIKNSMTDIIFTYEKKLQKLKDMEGDAIYIKNKYNKLISKL